ncbi:hypothetical protein [Aestuariivirga sp.]|uniref:hypothetical protein n=1 Tax=Aestuariivirga sp. TaxID=2650926 RepID=UPI0025C55D37|nr:hypothetical protein [Aestuariivirga sp.]MCA3554222.1 hypothetical protein [Aestuariivirga sp.]
MTPATNRDMRRHRASYLLQRPPSPHLAEASLSLIASVIVTPSSRPHRFQIA